MKNQSRTSLCFIEYLPQNAITLSTFFWNLNTRVSQQNFDVSKETNESGRIIAMVENWLSIDEIGSEVAILTSELS